MRRVPISLHVADLVADLRAQGADLLAHVADLVADLRAQGADLLVQPFLGFREVAQESFVENLEKVFLLDRPPLLLIVFEMPQHIHQRIGSGVAQLIPQRARHRHYSHGGADSIQSPGA